MAHTKYASFRAWTTRVSNPVCYPRFRVSVSVMVQKAVYTAGVPPDIYAFHRYTRNSAFLPYSSLAVFGAPSQLSREISHQTYDTTYTLFTPSNSEQRSLPTYYRGCWHVVSRSFFCRYRHYRSCRKSFTPRRASSLTRRRCIRVSPIVQDSPLLPPVGVWPVFQCQCGRVPSQAGYRSLAWWAFTPPTT